MKILTFLENPYFWVKCITLCTSSDPPITRRRLRRELEVLAVSYTRFPMGKHSLDASQVFRNRFGDFYFSRKNEIFGKSWKSIKIIENTLILIYNVYHVTGCCSLPKELERCRDRSAGRCRRVRVQKHVRNVASVVPTDFYGDWRSQNRFLVLAQKMIFFYKF